MVIVESQAVLAGVRRQIVRTVLEESGRAESSNALEDRACADAACSRFLLRGAVSRAHQAIPPARRDVGAPRVPFVPVRLGARPLDLGA